MDGAIQILGAAPCAAAAGTGTRAGTGAAAGAGTVATAPEATSAKAAASASAPEATAARRGWTVFRSYAAGARSAIRTARIPQAAHIHISGTKACPVAGGRDCADNDAAHHKEHYERDKNSLRVTAVIIVISIAIVLSIIIVRQVVPAHLFVQLRGPIPISNRNGQLLPMAHI